MIIGYLLLSVICATSGFNIFTKPVRHFEKKDDNLFGLTVIDSQQGVLVSSPGSSVPLLHCSLERQKCNDVLLTENVRKGMKPIISAAKKADEQKHMVCQQVRKPKAGDEDLNGNCTLLHDLERNSEYSPSSLVVQDMKEKSNKTNSNYNNNNFNSYSSSSSNHREELVAHGLDHLIHRQRRQTETNNYKDNEDDGEAGTEIAFVLDGSGSISREDFERAKDFICSIMQKVWEACFTCEFAVVQFGTDIRTELSLLENDNGTKAIEKVKSIEQVMNVTRTASAINHVLEHVFVAENGSKENAKKMIIVITDGDIFDDPMNLTVVLNSPKMKDVLRLAVGVGNAFNRRKGLKELREIASDEARLFKVDNYNGLERLLSDFEKAIPKPEGIQPGEGFTFELAEAGFSSHFASDGSLLFGAVGAYDWSGGLILKKDESVTFLNDTSAAPRFSYLGYSVTSAQGLTQTLYISGAPRYNLSGSVLIFSSKSHLLMQTLPGEQVGSYFGAVLCAFDFDKDSKTDYLLVGAPYYHIKGEEGKVYLYKLNQVEERFDKEGTEWKGADGYEFAMFGSAIADIGDIDGNKFNDLAVGAPLEGDEVSSSSGSIYIYNGYKGGIRPHYSQRISAADLGMKLRFFGRSVSAMSETPKNQQEYISVGSEGSITVLQALQVIAFKPSLKVTPENLPTMTPDMNERYNEQITLQSCLNTMRGVIKEGSLPILYQVDLDTEQATKRLSLVSGVSKMGIFHLTPERECFTIGLKFMGCRDCYSPIIIKMNFALQHNSSAGRPLRILDKFSETEVSKELPFQRDCGKCVAKVSLSESRLNTNMIVVGHSQNLNAVFDLVNTGDASYMTTLFLTHPNILLFDKSDSFIVCRNEERYTDGENSLLKCNIMHPVLQRGVQVSFSISWQIVAKKTELRTANIHANLTCANNGGEVLDTKSYKAVMKNALKVKLQGKITPESLTVNKTETKNVMFKFEVYGENKYNATLFVNIHIVLLAAHTELRNVEISKGKCHSLQKPLSMETFCFRCAVGELQDTIIINAEALVKDVEGNSGMINATATLEFDGEQYEMVEMVDLSETVLVPIIKLETKRSTAALIGGSIGGFLLLGIIIVILVKCGFFRSRYSVEQAEGTD
ncbi:hypothetical protein GJAV_G00059560 [Gymnothorax javanicus]|nr:hypothetical protein GJAV_G00059560 [Gymnothorax javanicus]